MSPSILIFSLVFFLFATLIATERVAIQAGKSFCVFEDLKIGTPWGVQFQSDEHEIKTIIRSPSKVLYNGNPETYGSYSIKTDMDGRYSVCFENPSGSIQKVSFNFLGGQEANSPKIENSDKPDQIQVELQELNNGLKYIQNEQDYMIQREKIHRQIAQKSNSRIFYWFIFQGLLVAASVIFEIYYVKSFFEKRRVV